MISIPLVISGAIGALVGSGLKWLAGKTKNKTDDKIAQAINDHLVAHPELIGEIAKRVGKI